jgi:hypothetical protein
MATGEKDGDREAELGTDRVAQLERALEAIRKKVWKPGQTLPRPAPDDCVDPARTETLMPKGLENANTDGLGGLVLRCGKR